MPILNNIPRKNAPKIRGDVFRMRTHGHDTLVGFEGLTYNSPFTESATPPLLGQFNTATQPQLPALKAQSPGVVVPLHKTVRTGPQERTVLHTTGKVVPIVSRVGGPSPTSDTPFHPKPAQPRPMTNRKPGVTTEKGSTASSVATGTSKARRSVAGHVSHPISSFQKASSGFGTLGGHAHSDSTKSRWNTIKTGAAG
jgi:hypothetical protein